MASATGVSRRSAEDRDGDEFKNTEVEEQKTIIEVLDEYSFIKIFSFLPLSDLVRSERVCRQWKYLVYEYYKSIKEFKVLKPNKTKLRELFKKIGFYLSRLYIDNFSNFNEIREVVDNFCPNLIILNVGMDGGGTVIPNMLLYQQRSLFSKKICSMVQLVLERTNCQHESFFPYMDVTTLFWSGTVDSDVEVNRPIGFSSQPDMMRVIRSDVNNNFRNMIFLKLYDCLENIINMKNLKGLYLEANQLLDDDLLREICVHCKNIVTLDISFCSNAISDRGVREVWKLQDLAFLNVSGLKISDESFMTVGEKNIGKKLESFVCGKVSDITETTIRRMLLSCPCLEFLNLSDCKHFMRANVVEELFKVYHGDGSRRRKLCLFLSIEVERPNFGSIMPLNINDFAPYARNLQSRQLRP